MKFPKFESRIIGKQVERNKNKIEKIRDRIIMITPVREIEKIKDIEWKKLQIVSKEKEIDIEIKNTKMIKMRLLNNFIKYKEGGIRDERIIDIGSNKTIIKKDKGKGIKIKGKEIKNMKRLKEIIKSI